MAGKVCVRCNIELRCKQNSVGALSMGAQGPLELFDADLWECPICHIEMLVGFGKAPVAINGQPDFAARVEWYPRLIRCWANEREREECCASGARGGL